MRTKPWELFALVYMSTDRAQHFFWRYFSDDARSQERDPEIAARMKAFYDGWWAKLGPALNEPIPIMIGSTFENPVLLTSIDWWEVDADNINFVSQGVGGPRGGIWTVQVEREGRYRVELRRWPFHTNKPIGSEGPRSTINGRALNHQFKLMPAHEAVLATDGAEQRVGITPESLGAVFQISLNKGKSKLQGWFRGDKGDDLCGAYYALVTRLGS